MKNDENEWKKKKVFLRLGIQTVNHSNLLPYVYKITKR